MNSFKNDFLKYFLDGMSAGMFASGFLFAFLGIFISLILQGLSRDPLSSRTPFAFSWTFFFSDNMTRIYRSIILNVLVIFISLRFAENLIGEKMSMFYSLMVGFGLDKIIEMWKRKKETFFNDKPKL